MYGKTLAFEDLQEKLLELGATTTKKTTSSVAKGYVGLVDKAFSLATGAVGEGPSKESQANGKNHDAFPPHLADMASQFKDQKDLAKVRSQLAGYQTNGQQPTEQKPAFNSFFRQYKQEEESYVQKLKRKKQEQLQQEEHERLQKERDEERERENSQVSAVPAGKIRKNIFGKVKKRATMLETKVNAGKQ